MKCRKTRIMGIAVAVCALLLCVSPQAYASTRESTPRIVVEKRSVSENYSRPLDGVWFTLEGHDNGYRMDMDTHLGGLIAFDLPEQEYEGHYTLTEHHPPEGHISRITAHFYVDAQCNITGLKYDEEHWW